jgi:hypothetical protein
MPFWRDGNTDGGAEARHDASAPEPPHSGATLPCFKGSSVMAMKQ